MSAPEAVPEVVGEVVGEAAHEGRAIHAANEER